MLDPSIATIDPDRLSFQRRLAAHQAFNTLVFLAWPSFFGCRLGSFFSPSCSFPGPSLLCVRRLLVSRRPIVFLLAYIRSCPFLLYTVSRFFLLFFPPVEIFSAMRSLALFPPGHPFHPPGGLCGIENLLHLDLPAQPPFFFLPMVFLRSQRFRFQPPWRPPFLSPPLTGTMLSTLADDDTRRTRLPYHIRFIELFVVHLCFPMQFSEMVSAIPSGNRCAFLAGPGSTGILSRRSVPAT